MTNDTKKEVKANLFTHMIQGLRSYAVVLYRTVSIHAMHYYWENNSDGLLVSKFLCSYFCLVLLNFCLVYVIFFVLYFLEKIKAQKFCTDDCTNSQT